ncbi:gp35 [Synechococcus phage S-CBP42]|uniref:Gp35 n=1 Tax=Synechococcus phage S-CBP42 TaxID=461711 RepID=G8EYG5_9CAUD|nr:gp35 [Synechococcus phage S-CBP42]
MNELSREDVFGGVEFLDRLLEELESAFPQYQPTPTDDIRKIMYQAGQRSVVEYIKDKQEKN